MMLRCEGEVLPPSHFFGDLIFGKGRSHFWKREISFLEKEDLIFGNVASIVGNKFSFLEMLLP